MKKDHHPKDCTGHGWLSKYLKELEETGDFPGFSNPEELRTEDVNLICPYCGDTEVDFCPHGVVGFPPYTFFCSTGCIWSEYHSSENYESYDGDTRYKTQIVRTLYKAPLSIKEAHDKWLFVVNSYTDPTQISGVFGLGEETNKEDT